MWCMPLCRGGFSHSCHPEVLGDRQSKSSVHRHWYWAWWRSTTKRDGKTFFNKCVGAPAVGILARSGRQGDVWIAELQDLEFLETKVKLLSVEFISDDKIKNKLCLAKVKASSRSGSPCAWVFLSHWTIWAFVKDPPRLRFGVAHRPCPKWPSPQRQGRWPFPYQDCRWWRRRTQSRYHVYLQGPFCKERGLDCNFNVCITSLYLYIHNFNKAIFGPFSPWMPFFIKITKLV
jgi:hypothetical protein